MPAKAELRRLRQKTPYSPGVRCSGGGGFLLSTSSSFVYLEPRRFEVLYDPLREPLPGIVRSVLLEDTAQQVTTAHDQPDRERELITERTVIHSGMFLFCSCQ